MDLTDLRFQDPDKARKWLEAQRWPHGPFCPHCGNADPVRIVKLEGKAHRSGLYQCKECREQFTVTVGTVMECSKIPLNKWVAAMFLLAAGKKGTSAHQVHRTLGITYQTAWFLCHRIREAMMDDPNPSTPMGGKGKVVEVDETYYGPKDRVTKRTKHGKPSLGMKRPVVALVERGERGGKSRMFYVQNADAPSVRDIIVKNISRESTLHTDEARIYTIVGEEFAAHKTVVHSRGEYVRGTVHTNTVESVFSVFKRGMKGTYQHCGEAHLHRYIAEFNFRYNRRTKLGFSDTERTQAIVRGAEGKRLMYGSADQAAHTSPEG